MAMDWDKLRVFHAVAEAGSFTHAGETLNLSQSAVSRQISTLEESLGAPLFHRHARGLLLTEQGDLLLRTVKDVFTKLSMTEALISDSKERPQGPLKVTTPVAFGSLWLTPRIREFLETYPEISVTMVLDDGELDLSMREADVAVRMLPPRQQGLIQRHLLTARYHVCATPEYLKAHGTRKSPRISTTIALSSMARTAEPRSAMLIGYWRKGPRNQGRPFSRSIISTALSAPYKAA